MYGCVYASMVLLDALRRCYWGFLSVHACAYACVYVCACVRVWVHVFVCMYVCMYFCECLCMFVCVRVHVDVRIHSCRRILFICTVQSLYYTRVYHHRCFLTLACVCGGGLEVGFVSACLWLALVSGVGGRVLAEVEIRVLSCIFLYFCGC